MQGILQSQEGGVVSGEEKFNGMKAYVYGEFSAPVTFITVINDGRRSVVTATSPQSKTLDFRYGISFISVEQAEENLRHEIPDWGLDPIKRRRQSALEPRPSARSPSKAEPKRSAGSSTPPSTAASSA